MNHDLDHCGDHCITCGDSVELATVVAVGEADATVELGGRHEQVAVELVTPVRVGDRVLCHAGIALEKVAV